MSTGSKARIAYLAAPDTLSGAVVRRADAFEHDLMMDALRAGAAPHGAVVEDIAWDAAARWENFDAVLIGTTWDYAERHADFLAALGRVQAATRLFNSVEVVRWNSHKRYLRDLAARGAAVLPTVWLDAADPAGVAAVFGALDSDDVVFKRQVGACAVGQHRLRPGAPVPAMSQPMLAQPFVPAITAEGELSFVFVDGALSHAVVKRPAPGDYRVQSVYGGGDVPLDPAPADVSAARGVLAALDTVPLYARVDMVRFRGTLQLMELELVEPFLYPSLGARLGERLVSAVIGRLSA